MVVVPGVAIDSNTKVLCYSVVRRRDIPPGRSRFTQLLLEMAAEFSAPPLFLKSDDFDHAAAERAFSELTERCDQFVLEAGGDSQEATLEFTAEARYARQVWEIDVPLAGNALDSPTAVADFVAAFHERHEQIFAVRDQRSPIHLIGLRASVQRAIASLGDGFGMADCASECPASTAGISGTIPGGELDS